MICYEIFTRSFRDGNGDGIGDLRGIVDALWYLEELGVDVIWLTPILSSPSFHGYDVSDYYSINPVYGDIGDFERLVEELHSREMKLVMDLPLNHTSSLHRWFNERNDFYIWASEKTDLNERRSWDNAPVWHPSDRGYFKGTFGRCLPDLNYENPEVVREILQIIAFWKEKGIDFFRFDAAKHIYDDDEKNLVFWRRVSGELGGPFGVAEVWDEPEIALRYADVVGFSFNFHLYGVIRKSMEDRKPWILYETLKRYGRVLRKFWNFLSSHDVTRIRSDVADEKSVVFAYSIIFTLPGIPVVYYGDELGIPGLYDPFFPENVAEPFPWTEDMCSKGQTWWKSVRYTRPFHGFSVEYQMKIDGILNEMKRWMRLRKENSWIDKAEVIDVHVRDNELVYTISGEGDKLSVILDFVKMETKVM